MRFKLHFYAWLLGIRLYVQGLLCLASTRCAGEAPCGLSPERVHVGPWQ